MAAILSAPVSQTAFTFNVRSLSHPGVRRTVELRGDQVLADLQGVIEEEFDLDSEHLWAFYLSGEWYDATSEFGRSGRAHDAELQSLGLEPGLRIAHLHDFGEEWRHLIDVVGVGEAQPGLGYPRVVDRVGSVPPRSGWDEREDEEQEPGEPFAPELIAELDAAIAASEVETPELEAQALLRSAAAVEKALDACPTRGRLRQLVQSVDGPFTSWFHDVVGELAQSGSTARAVAALERLAQALGYEPFSREVLGQVIQVAAAWDEAEYEDDIELPAARIAEVVHSLCSTVKAPRRVEELGFLVERSLSQFLSRAVDQLSVAKEFAGAREAASWLARADESPGELVSVTLHLAAAGLKDDARALLDEAEALPCSPSAYEAYSIARGYAAIGDDAAAEVRLRRLAGRRWIAARDRDDVIALLAEILERTGRAPEARAVEAEHVEWQRRRAEARGGTVRRATPRIGRNDPCPCGSGKKFKKCCGSQSSPARP